MKKNRILIIDDDELNSIAFVNRLEKRGFETTFIKDVSLVESAIEKGNYNLILLDIVMPNIDGISLLKQLRLKYSSDILPIIMVTAMSDSSDIFDAFEAGANDYITKPVHIDAAVSRMKGQISIAELNVERIRKKEIEVINAMVVAYHHEINNPLAIAKSELQSLKVDEASQNKIKVITDSLNRISSVIKKIQAVSDKTDTTYTVYESNTKMLKISKVR